MRILGYSTKNKAFQKLIIISILALLIVTLSRFVVGEIFNVQVLVVEGYHSMIDTVLSFLILVALFVSRSEWSKRYPYGLYRLEDLVAFILALIILLEFINQIHNLKGMPPTLPLVGLFTEGFSVLLLAVSAITKLRAGKLMNSPSLSADAAHMWVDVTESFAVTVGLILYRVFLSSIIYKITMGLALLGLLVAAYEAAKDSVLALLDLPRDPEMLKKAWGISETVVSNKAEITNIKIRWAGPVTFIEVSIRTYPLITIDVASRMASRIERKLKKELAGVENVIVNIQPVRRSSLKVIVPVEKPSLNSLIYRHFGKSQLLILAYIEHNKIKKVKILRRSELLGENLSEDKDVLAGADLAESMHEQGVTDVIVNDIGEIAYALLLRHRILIWRAMKGSVLDNINALLRGDLEPLEEPTREAPWRRH